MEFKHQSQVVAWFRDRNLEGSLNIRPPFQRKPVWTEKQKCKLIESILLKIPIPEIFVQTKVYKEGKVKYAIVDGQQRIRTVLQFLGVDTDSKEQMYNNFALTTLDDISEWKNLTFDELDDDIQEKFLLYEFSMRNLITNNDDEITDMFKRLNENLTPLNSQELRNATYIGPFLKLSFELAEENIYWAENGIVSPGSIRRMKDIELVSELLIGILHGPQDGNSKVIDEYYKQYEIYDEEFPEQRTVTKLFRAILDLIEKILPDIKKTKWSNKLYFYSLFVALGYLFNNFKLTVNQYSEIRKTLDKIDSGVSKIHEDKDAKVEKNIKEFYLATRENVSSKQKRGVRHEVLVKYLKKHFQIN